MARMLDVLESFLNLHAHTYVRLDGSTKPEQRQILMQVGGGGSAWCSLVPANSEAGRRLRACTQESARADKRARMLCMCACARVRCLRGLRMGVATSSKI